MRTKTKKYDNEGGTVEVLLLGLIFSIIFSASVIAFLGQEFYGSPIGTVPDLPKTSDIKYYSSSQNFTGDCSFQQETLVKSINSKYVSDCSVGMVLTQLGTGGGKSYLVIDNLQPNTNGIIDNTYFINNSGTSTVFGKHGDFCILLEFTGGTNQNEICFDDNAIYVPNYLIDSRTEWGRADSKPYPNANQLDYGEIRTVYYKDLHKADLYLDSNLIFQTSNLHDSEDVNLDGIYYGGVGSSSLYFTVEKFTTENIIVSGVNEETSIMNSLNMVWGFLVSVLKIILWNVDEQFLPLELNLIFIKTQLVGILICVVIIIRGG